MSTDDEDRPVTLAGGAQRALRAARAKAAAPVEDTAGDTAVVADVSGADTDTDVAQTAPVSPDADTVRLTKDDAAAAIAATPEPATQPPATQPTAATDDEPPVAPSGRAKATKPVRTTKPARTTKAERDTRRPAAARPARKRTSRLTAVASGLAVLALVFSVVSAVIWWKAGHNDDRTAALARDDVAVSARLAIATVNTSDYRQPANALTNWLAVSTGTLHSQFAESRKSATTLLKQAKTLTSAIVLDAAVTKLDTGKGSATVIASVNVKRKPATGAATTTRNRFRATMERVGGEWKLDDLKIVEAQLV